MLTHCHQSLCWFCISINFHEINLCTFYSKNRLFFYRLFWSYNPHWFHAVCHISRADKVDMGFLHSNYRCTFIVQIEKRSSLHEGPRTDCRERFTIHRIDFRENQRRGNQHQDNQHRHSCYRSHRHRVHLRKLDQGWGLDCHRPCYQFVHPRDLSNDSECSILLRIDQRSSKTTLTVHSAGNVLINPVVCCTFRCTSAVIIVSTSVHVWCLIIR